MAKPEPSSPADQADQSAEDSAAETTGSTGSTSTRGATAKGAKESKDSKDSKVKDTKRKDAQGKVRGGKNSKGGKPRTTKLSKKTEKQVFGDPLAASAFSLRAVLSLLLVVAGIAWIVFYYVAVRADPATGAEPTGPGFIGDLADWNYLIGFGAFFLGLILAAHPSTPLGRGRGVVGGMLFCFLFGLVWICTFYAITANPDALPVFDDLGQKNLFVGIAAMGVGFVYATRWE